MTLPLTQEIKDLFGSGGDAVTLQTLQFDHANFLVPYRIVNDAVDLVATLEDTQTVTFTACPFEAKIPSSTGSGVQAMQIKVDGVDQLFRREINAARRFSKNPIEMTYRIFTSLITSAPQNNPPLVLYISTFEIRGTTITFSASRSDFVNRNLFTRTYDRDVFPGLFAN